MTTPPRSSISVTSRSNRSSTLASQIGFAEEARRRGIAPAILFVITPDRTSVEAYRDLRSRLPQATLTPVHNEMLGPAQHRDKYPITGSGAALVRLPALAPGLRRYYRQAAVFVFGHAARQCARHPARRAYRAATLAAQDLSGVPGTRPAHSARRPAILDPAIVISSQASPSIFTVCGRQKITSNGIAERWNPGTRSRIGALLRPDFPRAISRQRGG